MTVDPTDPSGGGPSGASPTEEAPPPFQSASSGNKYGGFAQFEQFLGPQGFKKFQALLENMIREQISQEEQKARKALRELKNAEEGKPWEDQ